MEYSLNNLSRLARNLKDTIIIDNSPVAYLMHPECALPISSWYDDMDDTELFMLSPILEELSKVEDVRTVLKSIVSDNKVLFNKAAQILKGGRVGERSHSQAQKHIKPVSVERPNGNVMRSNVKPAELFVKNSHSESITQENETKSPALSYFKSVQHVNRKSRTSNFHDQK